MWERIKSQPWMVATIVLAVGLVIALVALLTQSGDEGTTPVDEGEAVAPTSTSIPAAASTSVGTGTTAPATGGATAQLAVVVDNAPASRPQVGIGEVPLLVEYPVEGGITRFNVLVPAASVGLIGPVRSLRPVNATLLPALTSAVVSTGGQPFVIQDVTAAGLTSVTPDVAPGFITLGRPAPHNFFLDLDLLADLFVPQASGPGLPAGDSLPPMTGTATEIELPYDGVGYTYEPGIGYVRRQDGQTFEVLDPTGTDAKDLSHDTIVVMSAAERPAGYQDSNGVAVSTFDVIGSGDLMVLHEGELLLGTWSRSALVDPFVLRDQSGESFGLPEGRVYVAIVPRDSEVTTR